MESSTGITIAPATLSYTSASIRSIASMAKEKSNYLSFSLPLPVRAWVIAPGIRKHPRLYRQSKGGKCLFYRITTLIYRMASKSHLKGLSHNINHENLWTIECQKPYNALQTGLSVIFDCNCAVVNCRSVGNKINDIKHEIYNHNLDLCALTETWIKEGENTTIPNHLCPPGHNTISIPHINRIGGVIALVYRSNLDVKNTFYTSETMECVDFNLNLDRHNILLAVTYRPPDTSVLQLANESAAYMERNINTTGEQIIVGDFNIHINKQDESNAIILSDMLESFNLSNFVEFPTHKLQNTLDLVINQQDSRHIRNVQQGHLLCDHHLVLFDITSKSKVSLSIKQAFRKYKSISLEDILDDVTKALKSINITDTTTNDLVSAYDRSLRLVLDICAPLKVKSISCRRKVPGLVQT